MKNLCILGAALLGLAVGLPRDAAAITTTNGDVLAIYINITADVPVGDYLNLGLVSTELADGGCSETSDICVRSSSGGFGPRGPGSVTYSGSYLFSMGPFLSSYTLLYYDLLGTFDVEVRADLCPSNASHPCSYDNLFAGMPGWDGVSVSFDLNPAVLPIATYPYPNNVPIPGTLPLFVGGVGALGLLGRQRTRKASPRSTLRA